MLTLRENQIKPVELGIEHFNKRAKAPAIIIGPTGVGKSIIIAHICMGIKGKTLVLQPSKELLDQNIKKLQAMGGTAAIFSASFNQKEFDKITYATIGSIKGIGSKFRKLGYKNLIMDECDRYPRTMDSMIGQFLKDAEIESVLGLTATPFKLHTYETREGNYSVVKMLTSVSKEGNFFKDILHVTQIQDMGEYWAKLQYEEHEFDLTGLSFNTRGSEYSDTSLIEAYRTQNVEGKILNRLKSLDRKRVLVFVPSVASARTLAGTLTGGGYISGDMNPKERLKAIDDFRSGKIRVMFNVNVLSVGFDEPEIDCIILGRPTASLSMYYQQVGRGVRPCSTKSDCLIIDFVGNVHHFGRVEHFKFRKDRVWKLIGEKDRQLTGSPIKELQYDKKVLQTQAPQKAGFPKKG
jgi:DNA repair protein RadD